MQNIAKAQAEIDKLEEEATAADASSTAGRSVETSRKPASDKQVNGSASAGAESVQEKDNVAGVTKDLENAKLENGAGVESTA